MSTKVDSFFAVTAPPGVNGSSKIGCTYKPVKKHAQMPFAKTLGKISKIPPRISESSHAFSCFSFIVQYLPRASRSVLTLKFICSYTENYIERSSRKSSTLLDHRSQMSRNIAVALKNQRIVETKNAQTRTAVPRRLRLLAGTGSSPSSIITRRRRRLRKTSPPLSSSPSSAAAFFDFESSSTPPQNWAHTQVLWAPRRGTRLNGGKEHARW